jgi:hypothetical protein
MPSTNASKSRRPQSLQEPNKTQLASAHSHLALLVKRAQEIDSRGYSTEAEKITRAINEIADSVIIAASYYVPKTLDEAVLCLVLAADCVGRTEDAVEDYDIKWRDAANRLLYGVARYFKAQGGKIDPALWEYYMPDRLDPHTAIMSAVT